ncbi:NAD(P)-dependent oxidoreductase [Burkholderia seminalis]|uniref:NAD(P)-dependent oxidoreductase n=2 Tax=Burkholderia cepacia complex TaxID=87882 RepID=A0A8A8DFF6_9BURK|nr:NAD(P)-dependent oxidoreductase [Burkholderia seminalis]
MSDVTIIGLGNMGAALAATLLEKRFRITVWNRTAGKTAPLVDAGAVREDSAQAAIAASPVAIVCLDSYATSLNLFSAGVVRNLSGRIVIQLSTGTAKEAREMAAVVTDAGARYLDGAILNRPEDVGSRNAILLLSGDPSANSECGALLDALSTTRHYLGDQPGAAAAHDCAGLAIAASAFLATAYAAAICQAEGVPLALFGSNINAHSDVLGREMHAMIERIDHRKHAPTHAPLYSWTWVADRLHQQAHDAGMDDTLPRYLSTMLARALDAGLGDCDLSAIADLIGKASPT